MGIKAWFGGINTHIKQALGSAQARGLTDDVTALALQWVKVAAGKALSNTDKREFVIAVLKSKGVPESIARLAVELGVSLLKAELARID